MEKKRRKGLTDGFDLGDVVDKVTFAQVHSQQTVGRRLLEDFQRVDHGDGTGDGRLLSDGGDLEH